MNMSRSLLLVVLTLAFVFVSRAFGAGDDKDLKSEHENKHEVSWIMSCPLSIRSSVPVKIAMDCYDIPLLLLRCCKRVFFGDLSYLTYSGFPKEARVIIFKL